MNRFPRAWKLHCAAILTSTFAFFLSCTTQAAERASDTRGTPAVETEAVNALNRMGAYLRTLSSFEIKSDTTLDTVLDNGQKIQLSGATDYKIRRPNHFVVTMASDRKVRTIYYDGKSLTVYSPRVHYYATISAPPTINETAKFLYDRYGIELPLTDLFRWGLPEDKHDDLKSGVAVGYAKIDGKDTDQYAFRQDGVDWQIWIQQGDKPLPLKVIVTTTSDPATPEFSSVLHWNTTTNFPDGTFAFKPPADAKPIKIASSNP